MSENEKNEDNKKYKDKKICEICKKEYTRSNITGHKRTSYHKLHEKFIKTIRDTIIGYEGKKTLDDILKKPYKTSDGEVLYLSKKQYNFYKALD